MSEDVRLRSRLDPRAAASGASDSTHAHTFQAREAVWTAFEAMARELGTPIDELVNDAMERYARSRGRLSAMPRMSDPLEETHTGDPLPRPADPYEEDLARTAARISLDRAPRANGPAPLPPPSRPMHRAAPPPPRSRTLPPPLPTGNFPPATQRMPHAPPGRFAPPAQRILALEYLGRTTPVDKERFSIGRSKTQSDLRLDDPNVSRQHAVIERVGAAWYIVDLGSTNGVEVGGERVTRRALADGDVIVITTHEIRCSFS